MSLACNEIAMGTCSTPLKQSKLLPTTFLSVARKSIHRTLVPGLRPKCSMTSVLGLTLLVLPRSPLHNILVLVTVPQIATLLALLVLLIHPCLTAPTLGVKANHVAPIIAATRIAPPDARNVDNANAKQKLLWLKGQNCLITLAFVKLTFMILGPILSTPPVSRRCSTHSRAIKALASITLSPWLSKT